MSKPDETVLGNLPSVQKLGETYVKGYEGDWVRFKQQRGWIDDLLGLGET